MNSQGLTELHNLYKEESLFGRYITLKNLRPIIEKLEHHLDISVVGYSVNEQPIHSIKIGSGKTKILLWSQMHGNESTTTKAIFDMLNVFASHSDNPFKPILDACTLQILPMLNPDGAEAYTRVNANQVDLNRDAQNLSQPESKVLQNCFTEFEPDFCFNLHGQRTIFGAGDSGNSATLSFLSPSADDSRSLTDARKTAMAVISRISSLLYDDLPNAIGRYDDGFNLNCVGDTFQTLKVPTILYEAGHYKDDYAREEVRLYVFKSICYGLNAIANGIDDSVYDDYFKIPENKKNFYDVIIKNVKIASGKDGVSDVAIQFKEVLNKDTIEFIPIIEKIERLDKFFAHKIIEGNGQQITNQNDERLKITNEIDFVMLNGVKYLIKP